jgi:hypothetical protein
MSNRSRTISFRRSVISVTAAFAAAPGCSIDHHPPVCSESRTTGCIAPVECTDDEPPEQGAPCAEEGATCNYDFCSREDGVSMAVCKDSQWDLVTAVGSCNPPSQMQTCPEQTPEDGTPCSLVGDMVCSYGDCGGVSRVDAVCGDGSWAVYENSCNPPLPECPDEAPKEGDPCSEVEAHCSYGDCEGTPTITADCIEVTINEGGPLDLHWSVSEVSCNPPPLPLCPETPPEDDTACVTPELFCQYNNQPECGAGAWTVDASCTEGRWIVHEYEECQWVGD